jgi:DNA-directed RNA polymerase subunit RPC12/RpoP
MSKFIQTNIVRDRLQCPKCSTIFYKLRHKAQDVVCPTCGWDSSFNYIDEQGEE